MDPNTVDEVVIIGETFDKSKCGAHIEETAPGYPTEDDACAAFDAAAERSGLFHITKEAPGDMIQPPPWKRPDGALVIDRLLIPRQKLIDAGWKGGAIGVEIKASGLKVGPPLSQILDYLKCSWVGPQGVRVNLGYCFLFPMQKAGHSTGSIMAQNHIGSAILRYAPENEWYRLEFFLGEQSRLIHYLNQDRTEVKHQHFGNRVGSR